MTTKPHADRYLLAGVMGAPIMHSRSPVIHNHWLAQHGIVGHYAPLHVTPDRLERALRALPALGFSGVNLTIPLKEIALPLLDRVDPLARSIGAVNCVVVAPDGTLDGYNYDAFGYLASVREADAAWRADAGPALVLGAGGAARAIVAGLLQDGAPEVRLANRTPERAQALAAEFGEAFGPRVRPVAWAARAEALEGAALLVNTTSMGMVGQPPLEIALDALPAGAVVSDIVYAPLGDRPPRPRPRPRPARGGRPRHAAASGAARLRALDRRDAVGDAGAARQSRGDALTVPVLYSPGAIR